jgi:hypothetical protein
MERYARRCDVTHKGMNEGWCWGDGAFYTATEKSTITELRKEYPSKVNITDDELMQYAYDNEVLYWTEWSSNEEIEDQGFYYTENGEEICI